jgi:hypothetical protein
MTFHEACRSIVAHQGVRSLNYAIAYAKHGLLVRDAHEQKVQALYILNNMTHWRGDIAKRVREALKQAAKGA